MQELVEDFVQHLRNERGQSENTEKAYFALLSHCVLWADHQGLKDWKDVRFSHLMSYLQFERERPLAHQTVDSPRRLSSESVYLEIAALRAFYRWGENEKFLPDNIAENLSLPRRWKRLPKSLSDE